MRLLASTAERRVELAARNISKGVNALNVSAADVLSRAFAREAFTATHFRTESKHLQKQWRTINQEVVLPRDNGGSTEELELKKGMSRLSPILFFGGRLFEGR